MKFGYAVYHAFRLNDAFARDSTILIGGILVVAVEILIGITFFGH